MDLQPLDFEKPIFELERRLQDLKDHSDEHDVDLDSAVKAVEAKLRETRREIYGKLTAWQRVQIARHVQRPFAFDYIERCFTNWIELHGDRRFADDKAMPSGLAMLGTQRWPPSIAKPHGIALSSAKRRSPCSSSQLVKHLSR